MNFDYADDVIYIGIGNSDDRLTQAEWCNFMGETLSLCMSAGIMVGRWYSEPAVIYQNACFCVGGVKPARQEFLRRELGVLAARYRQDSISFVEGKTVLIKPGDDHGRPATMFRPVDFDIDLGVQYECYY